MVEYKEKQYNLDTIGLEECEIPTVAEVFRMEFSEPIKIKNKKTKNQRISLYKEDKIGIHTTTNGKGCVGKLIKK